MSPLHHNYPMGSATNFIVSAVFTRISTPTYGMSAFPDVWWWDAQLAGTTDRPSASRY
jgi:hypothetical protein